MTITTTIKAGELAKTITLNEGKTLSLAGAANSAGVAYLLDQVLGGSNSKQSWSVGVGALTPIGPYANTQKVMISCTAGSIDATVGDAVLALSAVNSSSVQLQVATRSSAPVSKNASLKECMSRSTHVARDRIRNPRIAIPNFMLTVGVESGPGGPVTATAAIEYPAGVFYQATFNGAASGSIPDNSIGFTDPVAGVDIPDGATCWVRIWRHCDAGILYSGSFAAVAGDGFVASAATTPDLTMGGTVTQATVNAFLPCAIVANTSKRAVGILGDSVGAGSTDTADGNGDIGMHARSVGQVAGYINLASPSDSAFNFGTANLTNRLTLLACVSDVIWQMGTNDVGITGAVPAATVLSRIAACLPRVPNVRHWMCTLPPRTTSTDSWATTANQTVIAATEAIRVAVNTGIRAVIAGVQEVFDTADALETSRNSGIFRVDTGSAAPAITADGVHLIAKGTQMAARSGAIPKALFASHY